ncbi:MAG: cardiolipin synthase [Tenericutes bacterium]|jgi:cardiolipin synthase|nr:cardiolipin synthase [Mycoplasmatota bacterium]
MKKGFMIFALLVFGAFVYTISAMQYNYISNVMQLFAGNIFGFIVSGVLGIIALGIIVKVLLKEDYAYNKSYWILIIVLNPILGIILYGIFARDFQLRKFPKTRPLISAKAFAGFEKNNQVDYDNYQYGHVFSFIKNNTSRTIYQDNTGVKLLNNGDQFFPRLEVEIQKAKSYIMMEFYIIKNDYIGRRILDLLHEKVKEGVKVYLLYDHFGSNKHLDHHYMGTLKQAGMNISIFDPQTLSVFNSNLNFRNHRKVTIIDGDVGFIGGMNLGDEYNHQSKRFGFWRDTQIMVEGKGVVGLYNVFIKDWYYVNNQVLDLYRIPKPSKQKGLFSVIESGPDYEQGLIKDVYLKMFTMAKKSIKITTPYLIIEPELMAAIKIASNSGVKIQLIVPGKHDYFTVGFATNSYYEQLLKFGVRIYEYNERFIHSKVLIIDDKLASVGTVNIDPRSLNLNFEVTAIFENSTVDELVKSYNEDLENSLEITKEKWRKRGIFKRIAQGWFNLFSPMF